MRRLVAALALAAAATTGCGAAAASRRVPGTASVQVRPGSLCSAGTHALPVATGGRIRAPGGAGRRPVVIAFHGATSTAVDTEPYDRLDPLADRDRFLVVYPQAARSRFWQLRPDEHEDIDNTRKLIHGLRRLPCVDPSRVYATGVSNGGGFAARTACDLADLVAAVAPVAGGYATLGRCDPARPVAVLELHGTADTVVPYAGAGAHHAGSVESYLRGWVSRDRCGSGPLQTRLGPTVTRLTWTGCRDATEVEHLRLAGTTHGWPGGNSAAAGYPGTFPRRDPSGLDAARVVWTFLRQFRIDAARIPVVRSPRR